MTTLGIPYPSLTSLYLSYLTSPHLTSPSLPLPFPSSNSTQRHLYFGHPNLARSPLFPYLSSPGFVYEPSNEACILNWLHLLFLILCLVFLRCIPLCPTSYDPVRSLPLPHSEFSIGSDRNDSTRLNSTQGPARLWQFENDRN